MQGCAPGHGAVRAGQRGRDAAVLYMVFQGAYNLLTPLALLVFLLLWALPVLLLADWAGRY